MKRTIFLVALGAVCWWGMMLVHEMGHVLTAWVTGGSVARVEWPLVGFSRTELAANPHPVVVAMAGALVGGLLPLLVSAGTGLHKRNWVSVQIFSGFCLVANGAYLAAGSAEHIGDAGDLLKIGVAAGWLWGIGIPLVAAGLWQWHRLGAGLGMGRTSGAERWIVVGLGGLLMAGAAVVQGLGGA